MSATSPVIPLVVKTKDNLDAFSNADVPVGARRGKGKFSVVVPGAEDENTKRMIAYVKHLAGIYGEEFANNWLLKVQMAATRCQNKKNSTN